MSLRHGIKYDLIKTDLQIIKHKDHVHASGIMNGGYNERFNALNNG